MNGFLAELSDHDLAVTAPVLGDWTARPRLRGGAQAARPPGLHRSLRLQRPDGAGPHACGSRPRVSVPSDLSIVGFDDIPEAKHFAPPLTTIRQDFGWLGARAIDVLVSQIEGEDATEPEYPVPELSSARARLPHGRPTDNRTSCGGMTVTPPGRSGSAPGRTAPTQRSPQRRDAEEHRRQGPLSETPGTPISCTPSIRGAIRAHLHGRPRGPPASIRRPRRWRGCPRSTSTCSATPSRGRRVQRSRTRSRSSATSPTTCPRVLPRHGRRRAVTT